MKKKLGRPKLRSYKALRKQAWDVFSLYIRRRDMGQCFTCNKVDDYKNMDAGHYIHLNALDFSEVNINCQCTSCNRYLSGNSGIYAEKLIRKYGLEAVEKLRALPRVRKFSRDELEAIIADYKEKLQEFNQKVQNMKTYQIECGKMQGFYEGENIKQAFNNAMKINSWTEKDWAGLARFRTVGLVNFEIISKGKWYYQEPRAI